MFLEFHVPNPASENIPEGRGLAIHEKMAVDLLGRELPLGNIIDARGTSTGVTVRVVVNDGMKATLFKENGIIVAGFLGQWVESLV